MEFRGVLNFTLCSFQHNEVACS